MDAKEALHQLVAELPEEELRAAKRYLEVTLKAQLTKPRQSLERTYLHQLADALPASEISSVERYFKLLQDEGDPTVNLLLDEEEAAEADDPQPFTSMSARTVPNERDYPMLSAGTNWRLLALLSIAPFVLSLLLGIIPGLLLGLVGWHKSGAVVLSLLWAAGYVAQRSKNFSDVNFVTFAIAGFGALAMGTSIWLFGTITS